MTIPQEQWEAFLREWQQSRAESESFKQEWRQFKEEDSAFKLEWQQFKKENEAFKLEWQQFRTMVAANFTKLEERVIALEERQTAISIDLNSLKGQISVIEQRFDIAEHKLGCIDRDLDKIDETLTQLRGRFDILEFNSQRDNSKIRMLESGYERHRDLIPNMIAKHEDLLAKHEDLHAGTSQSVDFMQTFHQQHATRLDMIEESLFPNWSSDGAVSENTTDVKYTPVTVLKADVQRFRHLRLRAAVLSRLVEPGYTLEESRQRRFEKFGGEQQFMEYWKKKQKAEYAQFCADRGTTPEKEYRKMLEKHGSNSNILKALVRDMKEKGKESRRRTAVLLANF